MRDLREKAVSPDLGLLVAGRLRHRFNSEGNPIAESDLEIVSFYEWFSDSGCLDELGRPLVVHHGTKHGAFEEFSRHEFNTSYGHFFTVDKATAEVYATFPDPFVHSVYLRGLKVLNLDHVWQGECATPEWMIEWARGEISDGVNDVVEQLHSYLSSGDLYSYNIGRAQSSLLAKAEDEGFDLVVFYDNGATSCVVFESGSIRSVSELSEREFARERRFG